MSASRFLRRPQRQDVPPRNANRIAPTPPTNGPTVTARMWSPVSEEHAWVVRVPQLSVPISS